MKTTLLALTFFVSGHSFANAAVQSPVEPSGEEAVLFRCSTEELNDVGYRYSIDLSETSVSVFQSSTIARYRPLVNSVERLQNVTVQPEGEPLFSCVYEAGTKYGYTATLNVYEDLVAVYQSSMIARYAPIYFSKLGK